MAGFFDHLLHRTTTTAATAPAAVAPIIPQPASAKAEETTVMAFSFSSVLTGIAHFFTGAFTKALPALAADAKAELATVETSVITFAKSDLGKLAIDAVAAASALPGGTNSTMFAAAKTKFIADAKAAGHDLSTIGLGVVDWMIQTAYTFTANVVANAQ